MIEKWLNDIKEGRPLWLAECRAEMDEDPEAVETQISVLTEHGEQKEFTVKLPKVETPEEIQLMYKYLDANRVNAAMLLGQFDNTDCRMPDPKTILSQIKPEPYEHPKYQMPAEPLICGVDVGGSDIKLVLCEGDRIRRILAYDWNPSIASEAAMILNPIYELIEMAANGMKLDGIGLAFPDGVSDNKIYDTHTHKTEGIRNNKNINYEEEFNKISNLDDFLRPLVKDGAPIRIANDGSMAAFAVYNELKQSEAGRKLIQDGIIALPIGTDIGMGWVDEEGRLSDYPEKISNCIFRIDNEEEAGFLNQERVLRTMKMPVNNPKPCVDMLINMAESGEANADAIFKNIGFYLGHVIKEIQFFMQPKTNKYILLGRFASSEYVFDLMTIGLQKIVPDAVVLQMDRGIANTPIMKNVAEISDIALTQFAQAVGCIYYVLR